MDNSHPEGDEEQPPPDSRSTMGETGQHVDLATVLRVSQALSGEIELEKLTETLLRTAIEATGAKRGLLVQARGSELRIQAEAKTSGGAVTIRLREAPISPAELPESLVQHVVRTQECVVLDDAVALGSFSGDEYVRLQQARSVLCLPLLMQKKLLGLLYLENNLAAGIFTRPRLAILSVLTSQAALSLENDRLYRELAEGEAKVRRLIDANVVGILIWDIDGRILEANDEFLRIVGCTREDVIAGRLRQTDLAPSDWRGRDPHGSPGLRRPIEQVYFRKDGSAVSVLVRATPFDANESQGISYVLDLTERRQAEQALRESEEQWKAVFENNPAMLFMVDPSGTILSVNPFGAQQLGYTTEELIGRHVELLFHEADRGRALENKATCLARPGKTLSWELRKLRKNGEALWVRETARAMLLKNQPVVLVVSEDITEGKRAAEALREMQTQLAHANRVATMGQLTASIAHEVSQPVTATVSNAQAALRWLGGRPPDLEEVRQALDRIVKDGKRAGAVISRIRALSKRAPAQRDWFDSNDAIREVVELTRAEATKNGVSLQAALAEALPLIPGDRVQVQQVMLNLIINAIEATSSVSGEREVLVSTRKAEPGGLLVAVRDSGPGLPPATLEHLFEAFYTTKPGGLGMGLSICHSIIDAHGGRLWAIANVPRGAIFQFTLPDVDRLA
ncbi:MAG TPA: PAS domain S-box protein [Myxococcaceae bacterium]|nr:PAS domain S-box protein [Myxococcaceae bacterium]